MTIVAARDLLARVRAGDPRLRLCDVRWYLGRPDAGREAWKAGHVPGAMFLDLDRDLAAGDGPGRHPLPSPADFAGRMGALGIGDEHDVVAYDDQGGATAARLWWMLDALGHRSVAVLDGGIHAWQEAGGDLTDDAVTHPSTTLSLAAEWPRTIDRAGLKATADRLLLLDARAGERYRGEVEPVDPAAGHIPGAISLPATANLGPDGRFLPADQLRERFASLTRSNPDAVIVTSCGSGVTACHNALAMRIAGLPDPILYPGSFSDWSRAGEPVATGADAGGRSS